MTIAGVCSCSCRCRELQRSHVYSGEVEGWRPLFPGPGMGAAAGDVTRERGTLNHFKSKRHSTRRSTRPGRRGSGSHASSGSGGVFGKIWRRASSSGHHLWAHKERPAAVGKSPSQDEDGTSAEGDSKDAGTGTDSVPGTRGDGTTEVTPTPTVGAAAHDRPQLDPLRVPGRGTSINGGGSGGRDALGLGRGIATGVARRCRVPALAGRDARDPIDPRLTGRSYVTRPDAALVGRDGGSSVSGRSGSPDGMGV